MISFSRVDGRISRYISAISWARLPPIFRESVNESLRVVDIGSLVLPDQPHIYAHLAAAYPCRVVSFEPQSGTEKVSLPGGSQYIVLPLAVGDGTPARFYKTRFGPASSTYRPNSEYLSRFMALPEMLTVEEEHDLTTVRLDDVKEVDDCDLLKLDIQGGELKALRGAERVLRTTPIVVTEVEFAPLYADQPLFGDVDHYLRRSGFSLTGFLDSGMAAFRSAEFGDLPQQLIWADAVYVLNDDLLAQFAPEKLVRAFLVAHFALGNPGVAAHLLSIHDSVADTELLATYKQHLHHIRSLLT